MIIVIITSSCQQKQTITELSQSPKNTDPIGIVYYLLGKFQQNFSAFLDCNSERRINISQQKRYLKRFFNIPLDNNACLWGKIETQFISIGAKIYILYTFSYLTPFIQKEQQQPQDTQMLQYETNALVYTQTLILYTPTFSISRLPTGKCANITFSAAA